MNRELASEILRMLGPRSTSREACRRLHRFEPRHWKRMLGWLRKSGLALYFWRRTQPHAMEVLIPFDIRQSLERDSQNNRQRLAAMREEFESLLGLLSAAGVERIALKGFSLVPDYCPDPALRTQFDFDFLIQPESRAQADMALCSAGFIRKGKGSWRNTGTYLPPARKTHPPSRLEEIYCAELHRPIELHTEFWEADSERIHFHLSDGTWDRVVARTWKGIAFPALSPEDALLYQSLHAFRHILNNWCRLSLFLEIAWFLGLHSSDTLLWTRFHKLVSGCKPLSQACGIVFKLAANLFDVGIPEPAQDSTVALLTPEMVLWIERYGLSSAIENFSGNKFSLFLHKLFINRPKDWPAMRRRRLFPVKLPATAFAPRDKTLQSHTVACFRQTLHGFWRIRFHILSALCYLWEIPSWRQASGAATRRIDSLRVLKSAACIRHRQAASNAVD